MIELPSDADGVPVMRTDFRDDAVWRQICNALGAEDYTGSGYEPNLSFVERRDLSSFDSAALVSQISTQYPSSYGQPFLIVVDAVAVSSPEHPVLLVDLSEDDTSAPFRSLPREIAAIEANLSIANMDFFEFGDNTDDDGVFRGFGIRELGKADAAAADPDANVTLDVDDDAATEVRREACAAAGRAITASLHTEAAPLSGASGAARIRVWLPRPEARLFSLIANLDISSSSTPNDAVVGSEFLMGTYLPRKDGFVGGPDGQILCQWSELIEPSRVSMSWGWMRTLPDASIEDRLPRRATLTVDLTDGPDDSTYLELVHDNIPIEWITHMSDVWQSKIDQWAYQSRPKRRRAK